MPMPVDPERSPSTSGPTVSRRHFLGGAAALGALILALPPERATAARRLLSSGSEAAPTAAPVLHGLVHRKGIPAPDLLPWLAGTAVAVDHAVLRPSPTTFDPTTLVSALDTCRTNGLLARLRVKFGTGAAPWLAQRCGTVLMDHAHPPPPFRPVRQSPVAAWWGSAYLDELAFVMGRLAASFDGHPTLADVNLAIGVVFSAGDGMLFLHENQRALRAAGYRHDDDMAARRAVAELYAGTWRRTDVSLGLAPFETLPDDGTTVVSNAVTVELASHARSLLGDRLVLAHQGLVGDAQGNPMGTADQRSLFRWMADRAAAGWKVGVQVEHRERILAEATGNPSVDGTVLAAVKALGARSVEIPADPSVGELRRWREYFVEWPVQASRWPKPPVVGLVDRDGSSSGYAYRRHRQHFGAIVGRVDHAEVHKAPGRFDFAPVDRLLDEAETYGVVMRLRLYLGIQVIDDVARAAAPPWLLDRVGGVVVSDPNWVGAGRTVRFWHPEYRAHHRELMAAMADRYDEDPRLAEVHGQPGALIGGETMIQRYDNAEALDAAGYPGWEADRDLQIACLQDYAELWTRTGCYFPINAFQRTGASPSLDTSLEIVAGGLAAMGGRLRPANNSLVANDRLVEQRGGSYQATYERMRDEWGPAGLACQIQTGNPTNIATVGDGSGTLDGTVRYAALVIGAASVELPHIYSEQLDQLPRWAALFPAEPGPPPGPIKPSPGAPVTATPASTDPGYCRGRLMGELYGDGHLGAGAWRFVGDAARRAELVRCLDVLGWPSAGTGGEVIVPFSLLASGWASLVPAAGATVAEVQGWCGGVVEGEGSVAGLVWDLTVRFATGLTLADRERTARDKTVWCAEQWRRLGAAPATLGGGDGDGATWRVLLAPEHHRIAQAIGHYVSWGRVPGGRP